ncbi:MAG: hypothetical protein LQ339_007299 [Xanthoria mediterranea]|nr:MAG: hypothetical protein LQ339_007299 [Xanthoria mediterranea]
MFRACRQDYWLNYARTSSLSTFGVQAPIQQGVYNLLTFYKHIALTDVRHSAMKVHFSIILVATIAISTSYAQDDFVQSGSYGIRYCGTGPGSRAETLQDLLPKFASKLRLVQADAQKGNESKAFHAFFKSQSNAPYVQGVFKQMANGRPAMVPSEGRNIGHVRFENPNLVCLHPTMPDYEALRQQCGSTSIATTKQNRALVLLCQPYWGLDEEPEGIDCPVVRRNVFTQNHDNRIMRNQFAVFVHEMAHAYAVSWIPTEAKGIMDCVALSAGASVKNLQNFALYAAMVVAGCNRYPDPDLLRGAHGK